MALTPLNEKHKSQIEAGTKGRKKGHKFEAQLSDAINTLSLKCFVPQKNNTHLYCGNPANSLIQYISNDLNIKISNVKSWWLGGLATSGCGDLLVDRYGNPITKSKSDILLCINTNKQTEYVGVSIKTCNKKTPTNDQMYFTTAHAFCQLLRNNNIPITKKAEEGLSMFCGDVGYRPIDLMTESDLFNRISDPNRYYWEELSDCAKNEWEFIFTSYQKQISLLLFQKAYKDDPYAPNYLLHQTVKYEDFNNIETAIFSMDEIVSLSCYHCGFVLTPYIIRKGRYKNDDTIHYAPRFGFIQFQRGGQKQHPTQLQFNLKSGYFRHI